METTQKDLAGHLDRAAVRADIIDRHPATSKQCWFLAHLIIKNNDEYAYSDALKSSFVLTKSIASKMIDAYLN